MAEDASTATDHIHGNVGHDAFGYSLHYHEDDYTPKAAASAPAFLADASGSALATASSPLYNGNISRMVTSVSDFTNSPILGSAFRYDQLNRLVKAVHYDDMASNQWGTTTYSPDKDSDHYSAYFYDANGNIRRLERNAYHSDTTDRKMDRMTYSYPEHSNRLTIVNDTVPDVAWGTDFDDMSEDFQYDLDGRLTVDPSAQIAHIDWNAQGKVRFIGREEGSDKALLVFHYDGMGNRVRKVVVPRNSSGETLPVPEWTFTYYIRDAQGNHLTTLERKLTDIDTEEGWDELHIQETMLYGSDRLGMRSWQKSEDAHPASLVAKRKFTHDGLDDHQDIPTADDYTGSVITSTAPANYARHLEGLKRYELKNHLGNVLATVSDKRDVVDNALAVEYYTPKVDNPSFYYPYGMLMSGLSNQGAITHKFGFNSFEKDDEVNGVGGHISWGDYGYNPKTIRRFGKDPFEAKYPWRSPYSVHGNNPILHKEIDGRDYAVYVNHETKTIIVKATFYTVCDNVSDYNSALSATTFWNEQSGKYQYMVGTGEEAQYYDIHFELNVQEVDNPRAQANFDRTPEALIPEGQSKLITDGSSNTYAVLPDSDEKFKNDNPNHETNGTTDTGVIVSIKESRKKTETGAHEVGHTLGFGHMDGTVMSEASNIGRTNTVNTTVIGQILKNAGIGKKSYRSDYRSSAKGNLQSATGNETGGFNAGKVVKKDM